MNRSILPFVFFPLCGSLSLVASEIQSKKRPSETSVEVSSSSTSFYSRALNQAQEITEEAFAYEQAKKRSNRSIANTSTSPKFSAPSRRFLEIRGILPNEDIHISALRESINRFLQDQLGSNTPLTPELVNLSSHVVGEMLTKLSHHLSVLAQAARTDDEFDEKNFSLPDYEALIGRKEYGGLIMKLHLESSLFILPFKKALDEIVSLDSRENPLSQDDVDNLIESIRKSMSYGTSIDDILEIHSALLKRSESIKRLCGALQHSIKYKPCPDQSVAEAFIGYAYLPIQFDASFESKTNLVQRARIMCLTVLSARNKNWFAITQLNSLRAESEDEAGSIDERIAELVNGVKNSHLSDDMRPLHYYGRELFEDHNFDKAQTIFKLAAERGDIRSAYEYLVHTDTDQVSPLLETLKRTHKGLACLLRAETHKEQLSMRKENYDVAGCTGYSYAYYQLAVLLKQEGKVSEALRYFCLAFEKGYYSAHNEIYQLCTSQKESDQIFMLSYQNLYKTFIGELIDEDKYKQLESLLTQK